MPDTAFVYWVNAARNAHFSLICINGLVRQQPTVLLAF